MKQIIIFTILVARAQVFAKDNATNMFIRDFVINEKRPTIVMINHLCWTQSYKFTLTKSMSSINIRSSSIMNLNNNYQGHTLLTLLDLNCSNATFIINQAVKSGSLNTPYRWLVIYDTAAAGAYDTLMNAPLLVNTDVVLTHRYDNNTFYMTELHRPSINHSMVVTERGWWSKSGIKDTRMHKEFFRRRKNLMLKPLVMTNVLIGINTTVEKAIAENKTEVDGLTNVFLRNSKLVFEMLNATQSQMFTADCGFDLGNDNWTGIVKDFKNGKADLGASCYMNHARMNQIDYGDTGVPVNIKFIFRKPPLSNVANIFILPFSTSVWIASMVLLALCGVGLFLSTRWEVINSEKNESIPDGSWGDVLLLTMGALCQQGCVVEPKKASGRTILLILCMSLMALYAAYSANIVVLLQASSDSIKTLQQLHDSKLTLAAFDIHYNHFWLKSANDTDLHRSVYKKITGKDGRQNFYDINDGVEKLRQGMFAFHAITEHVYNVLNKKFLESEKCDLVEMEYIMHQEVFPCIPKGSPHKELYKVVFKQIVEAGLLDANEKRLRSSKPKCSGSMVTFSSVGFTAFYPSLVFMCFGVVLSVILLLVEIIVHTISKEMK